MSEGNNIVPFPESQVEHINGEPLRLGQLSLSELLEIEDKCQAQLDAAQTDLMIVRDYRERQYPDGGGLA